MFSILSIALSVTLFIARVAGHGGVQSWIIRDETYIGYQPYDPPEGQVTIGRPYTSIDPLYDANHPWLACNNDGGPTRGGGQISAPIRAGDFIIAVWGYWIHPFGPGMVYMARCPGSCTAVNSTELDWFKIEHTGLIDGNLVEGTWGGGQVVATGIYNATIPEALADGEYLIRHELIALHPQWVGPQFYVECAQLVVRGGGGKLPPSRYLVKFPGGYKNDDPGLNVNLYDPGAYNIITYDIPGPEVWNGQDS